MPPRRPTRPAPPDVETLRTALGQGKLVRVGIAPSDQFPDGVTGRVRRIGDPAADGDEFIFVELSVGGAKDVLPFAAKDLLGSPARKATVPRTTPAPRRTSPVAAAPRTAAPVASAAPAVPSTSTTPPANAAPAASSDRQNDPATEIDRVPGIGADAGKPAGPRPRASVGAGPGRGKRPPVAITISTVGDESAVWRVEAKIGVRSAVRPTVVPPSAVWDIVRSLGEPRLTEVVRSLLEDHRRSTQARADALAAELSALRAELSSFPPNAD